MNYLLSIVLLWSATTLSLHAKSSILHSKVKSVNMKTSKGIPQEINYQGWLGNTSDTNKITDTLDMNFRLYDTETGGTLLWNETQSAVNIDKGIFNVLLGSVSSIPTNIFTGDPLWLETQVGNDTLSPRKKLVSVGYAIKSEEAEHSIYSDTASYASSVTPDNDWTISGSKLYAQDTSWNVGIGTISPSTDARLHVKANDVDYGVRGTGSSDKMAGVYGEADGAYFGIYGKGSTGKMAGVYGEANNADYGVCGWGSIGNIAGVYGMANNADYGIYGKGSDGKTAGIFADANGADYAGYFDGNVTIIGDLNVPNNQVSFFAYNVGDDAVGSEWQKVEFNTEKHDDGANFNTTTDRFTAPADGVYHFSANVGLNDVADAARFIVALYKNGSREVDLSSGYANTNDDVQVHGGSATIKLNTGDYIEVRCYSGIAITYSGSNTYTNFSGYRVY